MKKKIRDLTVKEAVNICNSHQNCCVNMIKCPFYKFKGVCLFNLPLYSLNDYLDEEVEVSDELFGNSE